MPVCSRCKTNVHPFSFRSYSKQSQRCSKCDAEIKNAVLLFINAFEEFAADGVLTGEEWQCLKDGAARDGLDLNEALYYARPSVLRLIDNAVELACKDEVITLEEERHINFLLQMLGVPDLYAGAVRERLEEWKLVERIRKGELPTAQVSYYLPPGETCHYREEAVYINTETKTFPRRPGELVLTNKRLTFSGLTIAPFDVEWRKVAAAVRESGMVFVQTTIKKGNGFFQVDRPAVPEALINRLALKAKEEPEASRRRSSVRPRAPRESVKTPYEVLKVSPGATREEVTFAYRQMAKLYHPDKVATLAPEFQEMAEMRMKEINAAYQTLTR